MAPCSLSQILKISNLDGEECVMAPRSLLPIPKTEMVCSSFAKVAIVLVTVQIDLKY